MAQNHWYPFEPLIDRFKWKGRVIFSYILTQENDYAMDRRVRVENWYTNNFLSLKKTFNEIQADKAGSIVEITKHDGDPVEFGEVFKNV